MPRTAAVSPRSKNGRHRGGLLPPLALAVTAVVLSTTPAAALAAPVDTTPGENPHPRITTVNRTEDLDPEGDTVTVSGVGHAPGSRIEVATWAAPTEAADAEDAGDAAITDTDNAALVDVGTGGTFTVALSTGAGFATEAGLDPDEDSFEIRVLEVVPPEDGQAPEPDAAPSPSAEPEGGAETEEDAAVDGVFLSPDATASAALVGQVPVTFAAPAAPAARVPQAHTQTQPQAQPQARPRPAIVPREPGEPRLTVSQSTGLDPDGQTVTVTGTGYDTSKGIYVALCDTSQASDTQAPGPCIGGVDMDGASGSSTWVSSNPPPYGEGLATPYTGSGNDGGFSVQLTVRASDDNTDCTAATTECAVVSRNDHTRSSDRSQDVFVPVAFGGQDANGDARGGDGGRSGDDGPDTAGGGGGDTPEGIGTLPRTGASLGGLVLGAAATTLVGLAALLATRRRRS